MKCPRCSGTGKIKIPLCSNNGRRKTCPYCNGTGKIVQTNEEWFCSLSTEEKAKFFHNTVICAMQATLNGKKPYYPAYLSDWKRWLKEKHE